MTIIKIDDEIGFWGITSQSISRQLNEASGDITIEISSPGGSVFEGISIYNAIKAYNKGKVTTLITSLAASMASVIALAGDEVKAYDNTVYMIHNASMWTGGDARVLRKKADHLESLTNLMAIIYMNKSGKSEDEIKQLLDEETYFYGEEMKEAGFIDELITSPEEGDGESAKALAIESVNSCMKHYKENSKDDEYEQVAAFLKENNTLGVNPASAKIENKTQGESMSKTYTEADVKALNDENAEALKNANAEAQRLERERASGIMKLGGNAEFTQKAIEEGMSVGDAAIALLGEHQSKMEKQKTDFEKAAGEVADVNEAETQDKELSEEELKQKEADEALANYKG